VSHGALRVRLDVTDVQAEMLLRAAGARRKAWNWAVAKIKANADQWHAEATYDIARTDRIQPLSYFTLGKQWTAERPEVAPWAGEHSTWTFRYALRDAANAHAAFLAGQRRFPRFKARHRDKARFTVRHGLALEAGRVRLAKYGWVRIAAACPQQAKLRRLLRRGHAVPQHITVSRHSDGRWYVTVTSDRQARTPDDRGCRRHRGWAGQRRVAGFSGAARPAAPDQASAAGRLPCAEGVDRPAAGRRGARRPTRPHRRCPDRRAARLHRPPRPGARCGRGGGPGNEKPDGEPVPGRRDR
jgi:hypothetical protein